MREVRRVKQSLSHLQCEEILARQNTGVMSVIGDEGYPYSVPLNFVYYENKIYFHSAQTGHKIDSLIKNPKVCFCVVDNDVVIPEIFSTYYSSVVIFGKARLIENLAEKYHILEILNQKYSPDYIKEGQNEIEDSLKHVAIVEITIDHMSGKESGKTTNQYYKKINE